MWRFWQMMYVRGIAAASVFCSSLTAARICGISISCTCNIIFHYEQKEDIETSWPEAHFCPNTRSPDNIQYLSCNILEDGLLMRTFLHKNRAMQGPDALHALVAVKSDLQGDMHSV